MSKFSWVCILVLAGCASSQGTPERTINPDRASLESMVIEQTLSSGNLTGAANPASFSKSRRNAIIQARLAEIDVLYYRYESGLSREVRQGNFGFSLAKIVVGGVGSQVSEATSRGLSALGAALEGTKAAYDKDVLLDQSLQAFIAQMRANRSAVKERIVDRYDVDPTDYTLQMALSDLADYEQAGTLSSALAGLTQSAQKQQEINDSALRSTEDRVIRTSRPAAFTPRVRKLLVWIESGTSPDEIKARQDNATSCYNEADKSSMPNPNLNTTLFFGTSQKYKEVEDQVFKCLVEKFNYSI